MCVWCACACVSDNQGVLYFGQVLSPHFGGIIRFVKEVEPLMEQGSRESVVVDESMLPWHHVVCVVYSGSFVQSEFSNW